MDELPERALHRAVARPEVVVPVAIARDRVEAEAEIDAGGASAPRERHLDDVLGAHERGGVVRRGGVASAVERAVRDGEARAERRAGHPEGLLGPDVCAPQRAGVHHDVVRAAREAAEAVVAAAVGHRRGDVRVAPADRAPAVVAIERHDRAGEPAFGAHHRVAVRVVEDGAGDRAGGRGDETPRPDAAGIGRRSGAVAAPRDPVAAGVVHRHRRVALVPGYGRVHQQLAAVGRARGEVLLAVDAGGAAVLVGAVPRDGCAAVRGQRRRRARLRVGPLRVDLELDALRRARVRVALAEDPLRVARTVAVPDHEEVAVRVHRDVRARLVAGGRGVDQERRGVQRVAGVVVTARVDPGAARGVLPESLPADHQVAVVVHRDAGIRVRSPRGRDEDGAAERPAAERVALQPDLGVRSELVALPDDREVAVQLHRDVGVRLVAGDADVHALLDGVERIPRRVEAPEEDAVRVPGTLAAPRDDEVPVPVHRDRRLELVVGGRRVDDELARARCAARGEQPCDDRAPVAVLVVADPGDDGAAVGRGRDRRRVLPARRRGVDRRLASGRHPAEHLRPGGACLGRDRDAGLDRTDLGLERPVSARLRRARRIRARRDVAARELRDPLHQRAPARAGGEVAAVEQDVRILRERIAPRRDRRGVGRERLRVEPRAAELHRAVGAVGDEVDRVDLDAPAQRLSHLRDAVAARIELDQLEAAAVGLRGETGEQLRAVGHARIDEDDLGGRLDGADRAARHRAPVVGQRAELRPLQGGHGEQRIALQRIEVRGHEEPRLELLEHRAPRERRDDRRARGRGARPGRGGARGRARRSGAGARGRGGLARRRGTPRACARERRRSRFLPRPFGFRPHCLLVRLCGAAPLLVRGGERSARCKPTQRARVFV